MIENRTLALNHANGFKPEAQLRRPVRNQAYDWLGAALRRKGILIFCTAVAAILGYLYHLRQPKVYASNLKFMIWTQVPPRIVEGESVVVENKTGKHQTLIRSEVVLEKSFESGTLKALATFGSTSSPIDSLREMLTVKPAEDAADTLVLTVRGRNPSELPTILTEVVNAYQQILAEDSASLGKNSVELITKLQERIAEDKSSSQERYLELVQKLAISPDPKTGLFVNPNFFDLETLHNEREKRERALRETSERAQNLSEVLNLPSDSRNELLRVLAADASKQLSIPIPNELAQRSSSDERQELIDTLTSRIGSLESTLTDLRLRSSKFRRSFGERHPAVSGLNAELESRQSLLTTFREQKRLLQDQLAQEALAKVQQLEKKPSVVTQVTNFESDLVRIYLASLKREEEQLKSSISSLDVEISTEELEAAKVRGEIEELNLLSNQIREKDKDIREILDQLSSLTVVASNYTSTKVRVIDSPAYGYQVAPVLATNLLLFTFIGAGIGMAIVILLDWSDMSFRNPEEIRERLNVPVVARISRIPVSGKATTPHTEALITLTRPKSAISEAYRACRTGLLFQAKQQGLKCFLVTSPSAGDGKSTTAANLAVCFAQGNLRTVIVDADLRRPRCHVYLNGKLSPGLKEFSQGDATAAQIIQQSSLHESLSVVAAGKNFANPGEFLDSAMFHAFVQELREKFDIVIIDSPPVLPVADSMALSSVVDGVLVVLKIRKGVVVAAEKAVETLRTVDANLLGVIVNQVEKVSQYSDYGKYGNSGYSYGGYGYYNSRYYEKENAKYYETESGHSES